MQSSVVGYPLLSCEPAPQQSVAANRQLITDNSHRSSPCLLARWTHLLLRPLILVSAIGEAMGMEYGREMCPDAMSADLFLKKPFDAATLRAAVGWVLEQSDPHSLTGSDEVERGS